MGKLPIASLVFRVVHRPFTKMILNCAIQSIEGQKMRLVLHMLWTVSLRNNLFCFSMWTRPRKRSKTRWKKHPKRFGKNGGCLA